MILGVAVTGLGIAIFRQAALGTDPFSGMNLALADVTGIAYPVLQIGVNLIFFLIQISLGRRYIGPGTIANAFFLAYFVDFFYGVIHGLLGDFQSLPVKVITLLAGLCICSLGLSMYQQSALGVAPYDALSLILKDRIPKVPYFVWRVSNDGFCALICFLAGGVVGLGTLVTAFGFGPVIQFFDRTLTRRMLPKRTDGREK